MVTRSVLPRMMHANGGGLSLGGGCLVSSYGTGGSQDVLGEVLMVLVLVGLVLGPASDAGTWVGYGGGGASYDSRRLMMALFSENLPMVDG